MPTVSDELVERVADAIRESNNYGDSLPSWRDRMHARAAIAALSTPEFVLPLAEAMLRSKGVEPNASRRMQALLREFGQPMRRRR